MKEAFGVTVELEIPELPMTPEDFEKLPEVEGVRFELVEGDLLVMNAAYIPWHGMMIYRLISWFERQGRPAFSECGIKLGKNRRTCDVGVFREPPSLRVSMHHPSAFTTVVEVVSEDSRIRAHVEKPRDYLDASIPEYWIVDEHETDPADGMISMFRLELTDAGPRYVLRKRQGVKELLAA